MRVFISGPYTQGDPVVNTRNAILAAEEVIKRGHVPFVPHLSHLWHMVAPHEYEFWLKYDLTWLDVCDILLRIPGKSPGADREVEYAEMNGIKVINGIENIESIG